VVTKYNSTSIIYIRQPFSSLLLSVSEWVANEREFSHHFFQHLYSFGAVIQITKENLP
jgi:hypothetical protein